MVMLGMWSVLWRENSHLTEVLTLMDICILKLYSMVNQWRFVSCIQYILPLNLLIFLFLFINVFLHTAKFFHTGEREDFMPAKMEQVCQSKELE